MNAISDKQLRPWFAFSVEDPIPKVNEIEILSGRHVGLDQFVASDTECCMVTRLG